MPPVTPPVTDLTATSSADSSLPPDPAKQNTVTLDEPIQRQGQIIKVLELRKPHAGELRGVSLVELAQMQVDALVNVLPRITIPSITNPEAAAMGLADLVECGTVIAGFLLPKAMTDSANT